MKNPHTPESSLQASQRAIFSRVVAPRRVQKSAGADEVLLPSGEGRRRSRSVLR